MELSPPERNVDDLRSLKLWFRELRDHPDGGGSLQHELLDAILTLRHTRDKDGWCNWDDSYHELIDTLRTWLAVTDSTGRIAGDLSCVRKAGESGSGFADEELKRLTTDVFNWCRANRELILLPEGHDFWSGVPAGIVPLKVAADRRASLLDSVRNWLSP